MSNNQLSNKINLLLKKIYNDYKFLNLSFEQFKDISTIEINEINRFDNKTDINYIKECVENKFNKIVEEKLNDANESIEIVNNYININFKKTSSYDTSLLYLKKLSLFFIKYDYMPNPDLVVNLINKNIIFKEMLKIITNNDLEIIKNNGLDDYFNDNNIVFFIETYCTLNGIILPEIEDTDIKDIVTSDPKKLDSLIMYMKEIGSIPVLTAEEEKQLFLKILDGDMDAKKEFIERNLKLVVSVAKRYINKGLDFLDLIQEGNIGLMTAIDKFDITKGYKFSTLATYWIRQSITRAIANKSRNIRIPVYLNERILKYKRIKSKLEFTLNREPSIEEIANEMQVSVADVLKFQVLLNDTVSMNYIVSDDGDAEFGDFIASDEPALEDVVLDSTLIGHINNMLNETNLNQNEINVLKMRYGLAGEQRRTLEEIGKLYGLTRERIRQIEEKALIKIRKSKYARILVSYVQNPDEAYEKIEFSRQAYAFRHIKNK